MNSNREAGTKLERYDKWVHSSFVHMHIQWSLEGGRQRGRSPFWPRVKSKFVLVVVAQRAKHPYCVRDSTLQNKISSVEGCIGMRMTQGLSLMYTYSNM